MMLPIDAIVLVCDDGSTASFVADAGASDSGNRLHFPSIKTSWTDPIIDWFLRAEMVSCNASSCCSRSDFSRSEILASKRVALALGRWE